MRAREVYLRGAAASLLGLLLSFAAPPGAHAGGVYFVKAGDTLPHIANLFGVDVDALRARNRLAGSDIKPGDRLRIPEPRPAVASKPAAPPPSREVASESRVHELICREDKVFHAVAKGDTLAAIGRRYNTTVDALLRLNGLRRTSRLSIGQKVLVRRSGAKTHLVRRGETLRHISRQYRVGVEELRRLNQIEGDRLAIGQRLVLEPCEQFALAGSIPSAPPVSGTAALAGAPKPDAVSEAEEEAEAALDLHDRREGALTLSPAPEFGVGVGSNAFSSRVINLAKTMLDIPYRFGGTSLRGIDCSAYVQRVFGLLEVEIPRTAREQYVVGERIDRGELSVGDLVFFRTYASFPSHVGIYLGDNLFIHASSVVRKVTIDSLDRPYYTKRFIGGRRLVGDEGPTAQLAAAPN